MDRRWWAPILDLVFGASLIFGVGFCHHKVVLLMVVVVVVVLLDLFFVGVWVVAR